MLIAPKWLTLRTSNMTSSFPGYDPLKTFEKGAWPGSRDPLNFWALNANSSKIVKARNFKFDVHVWRDSLDMTPKIFPKGACPRSRYPLNFWTLDANNAKTVKATDFKFDVRVSSDSPDMTR